ncbi:MAG: nuclear transport factor 2 family protein [Candidatus Limnocylindrales bacterium]
MQENAVVARQVTDAFEQSDFQTLDRLIADDVVWHEIGRSEPRRGKAALREAAPGGGDYSINASTHDILASDEHAVVMVNARATRGGRTFEYRTVEIYHIRAGKITERWAFSDDTARIAAFFA